MAKKATNTEVVDPQELMERLKVKKLFKNSKGEFFTNYNLALLSEKQDKDKIEEFTKSEPAPEEKGEGEGGGDNDPKE